MWGQLNSRAQATLQANLALDIVSRDGAYRRNLASERKEAKKELSRSDMQRFYSESAMDDRIQLRHSSELVRVLRLWSRALETEERVRTGRTVATVSEAMYAEAAIRWSLALTAIPSVAELEEMAAQDWKSDSKGRSSLPFERFKDAVFQIADLWVESTEPDDYAKFLEGLLQTICTPDGRFLDYDRIIRGFARPPGNEEDPNMIALRIKREEMAAARERREAALVLQRQQRKKRLEREAAARKAHEAELLLRAQKRHAAEAERRRQEAELAAALKALEAAGKEASLLEKARAARAVELKRTAEQSRARLQMRALGLLPALVTPRMQFRKLHIEDGSIRDARGWLMDGDEDWLIQSCGGATMRSLSPTNEPPSFEEDQARLLRELRDNQIFPQHARDILKRARGNGTPRLAQIPVVSPREGDDRMPHFSLALTTVAPAPFGESYPSGLGSRGTAGSPRRQYLGAGFRTALDGLVPHPPSGTPRGSGAQTAPRRTPRGSRGSTRAFEWGPFYSAAEAVTL